MRKNKRAIACDFTIQEKIKIIERDNGRCIFCNRQAHDIMHFISRAQGGLGIEQNGGCGCRTCHSLLDGVERKEMLEWFERYLSNRYDNWDKDNLIYRKE